MLKMGTNPPSDMELLMLTGVMVCLLGAWIVGEVLAYRTKKRDGPKAEDSVQSSRRKSDDEET